MPFSCFRASGSNGVQAEPDEPPRIKARGTNNSTSSTTSWKSPRKSARHGSAISRSSTTSNESISRLAPCSGLDDPKIDAMMMPVPRSSRSSRCLRLSQPRTYSNIIDSMKKTKGCRDWRSFDVFYQDEVDETMTCADYARKRLEAQKRMQRKLNSQSTQSTQTSFEVDMIC